jgi:hypothetical protein
MNGSHPLDDEVIEAVLSRTAFCVDRGVRLVQAGP